MAKLTNERKSQLRKTIAELEGLSAEDKSALIELLNTHKKYGLVWEDKPEDVEEAMRDHLPLLTEVKERAILSDSPEAPNHILIEGDNLEALTALSYTHEGKIDVIYIDPPYNTGNKDFIYNDSFVDSEDAYRHSKWLSFMSRRLKLAKRLLSDKGVIFISIDDNEQANLKLLCDEIFSSGNFIAQIIWERAFSPVNLKKHFSESHDYIITYVKNKDNAVCKGLPRTEDANNRYSNPDNDPRGLWASGDLSVGPIVKEKVYEIITPSGKAVYPPDGYCWRLDKVTFQKYLNENRIWFGEKGDNVPRIKRFLSDVKQGITPMTIWKYSEVGHSQDATKELKSIFDGESRFIYPKSLRLIKRLISLYVENNSIILDFFAGSGTTLHATMQLNAEDGGRRKCILVTNNENNICEEVTYERNKRVINGYTTPKGEKVEGLKNNSLRYYKTKLMSRERTQRNMRALVAAATELLCVKEDLYEEKMVFGQYKVNPRLIRYFDDGERRMLVIYREEVIDEVVVEIEKMEYEGKMKIYLFAPGRYAFDDNFYPVHEKVILCALPAAIYDAYEKVLPKHRIADDLSRDTACCVLDEQSELGQQKYVEQKLFSNEGGEQ